jgi:hypothetical protein
MDNPEKDVWNAAALMLDKHGADALAEAERRAKEATDNEDVMGYRAWASIAEAIRELVRTADESDRMN